MWIRLLALASVVTGYSIRSSCTRDEDWSRRGVADSLKVWLASITTIRQEGSLQIRLYDSLTGRSFEHYAGFNDQTWWEQLLAPAEIKETPTGGHCGGGGGGGSLLPAQGPRPDSNKSLSHTSPAAAYTPFPEEPWPRAVLTVAHFGPGGLVAARPRGLTWQRAGRYPRDGLLYGEVDAATGRFTGDNITFLYPDLVTGLRGTFRDGQLVAATEVRLVAARCRGGLKELLFGGPLQRRRRSSGGAPAEIVWRREETNATWLGSWPLVAEPHEWRSVYAARSRIPNSGEGLFAKRSFLPGDLISYYSGQKLVESDYESLILAEEDYETATAMSFAFGHLVPHRYNVPKDALLNLSPHYRDVINYRTTLGHKANHKFGEGRNACFELAIHPIFGFVIAIEAVRAIRKGEEIFVAYNYDPHDAGTPRWYRELYNQTQRAS